MQITEAYCTNNNRYKKAQKFTPQGVVLHSIGCPQPKARVLYNNWQRNPSAYATHYMIDDTEILHCIPDNYICYHVCSPGNSKWIGIEMGEPSQIKYKTGATFTTTNLKAAQEYCEKTYKNAVWLIAYLCKKYGWNPETDVYTHYEVTMKKLSNTDHVDPQHLWNGLGMGIDLAKLRKDVKAAMSGVSVDVKPSAPAQPNTNTTSTMYRIRKSWSDVKSQIGAYSSLENAKKAWKEGYYIYDANGKVVYPVASNTPSDNMYRIRKTWADAASQIGAYSSLENAKNACKSGYYVFDSNGKVVYPVSTPVSTSYMITVTADVLNIRKGPSTSYAVVGSIKEGGAYTIVETNGNWGKLKSGAGWICLDYTEKV